MTPKFLFFELNEEYAFNNKLVRYCQQFNASYCITNLTRNLSIEKMDLLQLFSLAARSGDFLLMEISGKDASFACQLLNVYFESKGKVIFSDHRYVTPPVSPFLVKTKSIDYYYEHYKNTETGFNDKMLNRTSAKPLFFKRLAELVSHTHQNTLLRALIEREAYSSTKLKQPIAIPHIISNEVTNIKVVLHHFNEPIDWTENGERIKCTISLILPITITRQILMAIRDFYLWLNVPSNQKIVLSLRNRKQLLLLIQHIFENKIRLNNDIYTE